MGTMTLPASGTMSWLLGFWNLYAPAELASVERGSSPENETNRHLATNAALLAGSRDSIDYRSTEASSLSGENSSLAS